MIGDSSVCLLHYVQQNAATIKEVVNELGGRDNVDRFLNADYDSEENPFGESPPSKLLIAFDPVITHNGLTFNYEEIKFEIFFRDNDIYIRGRSSEHEHPHMGSDGNMCMGRFWYSAIDAITEDRLVDLVITLKQCANTYTPGDSYRRIDTCDVCHEYDATYECPNCGTRVCDQCYTEGDSVCEYCATASCGACGRRLNEQEEEEAATCAVCNDHLCEDCQRNQTYTVDKGSYNEEGYYEILQTELSRVVCPIHGRHTG